MVVNQSCEAPELCHHLIKQGASQEIIISSILCAARYGGPNAREICDILFNALTVVPVFGNYEITHVIRTIVGTDAAYICARMFALRDSHVRDYDIVCAVFQNSSCGLEICSELIKIGLRIELVRDIFIANLDNEPWFTLAIIKWLADHGALEEAHWRAIEAKTPPTEVDIINYVRVRGRAQM